MWRRRGHQQQHFLACCPVPPSPLPSNPLAPWYTRLLSHRLTLLWSSFIPLNPLIHTSHFFAVNSLPSHMSPPCLYRIALIPSNAVPSDIAPSCFQHRSLYPLTRYPLIYPLTFTIDLFILSLATLPSSDMLLVIVYLLPSHPLICCWM